MNNFFNIKLVTINYTVTDDNDYVAATVAGTTITLPTGILGRWYYVKNQSSGDTTVQGTGELIENSAAKTLRTNSGITLVFDGTQWRIL